MPYRSKKELPKGVRDNLPKDAEEIYQDAFNNAYDFYKDPKKRKGNATREEVAHKVAWSAVKHKYEKRNDKWSKKKTKETNEKLEEIKGDLVRRKGATIPA